MIKDKNEVEIKAKTINCYLKTECLTKIVVKEIKRILTTKKHKNTS